MRVRRFLTTAGAIAAASIIALTPTAAHAAIAKIEVDGLAAPNGNIGYVGVMQSASATIAGYSPTCVAGSVSGVVKRGTGGLDPNPAFSFSSISMTCGAGVMGNTLTMALTCQLGVVMSNTNTVNVGKTDTNVTGVAEITNGAGTNCVRLSYQPAACTVDLSGSVAVSFDETVTTISGVDYQKLTLSGGGISTKSATGICPFLIPNNSAVTVSAVFLVQVAGTTTGVVDFQ